MSHMSTVYQRQMPNMSSTKVVSMVSFLFLVTIVGTGAAVLSGLLYLGSMQVHIKEEACLQALQDLREYREVFWIQRSVYNLLTERLGLPNIAAYREPSTLVCSVTLPLAGRLWLYVLQFVDGVVNETLWSYVADIAVISTMLIILVSFIEHLYTFEKLMCVNSHLLSLHPASMESNYVNASVQALASILKHDDLAIGNRNNDSPTYGQLAVPFKNLIQNPHSKDTQLQFKRACTTFLPEFPPGKQADAHEFLVSILCTLHHEYKEADSLISKISRLFFGIIRSTLTCEGCGHQVEWDERFITINLSLPSDKSMGSTPLEELLKYTFRKYDKIEGSACVGCNTIQTLVLKENVHQLPPYLIILLDRFTFSETNHSAEKNLCHITYPEMLSTTEFNSELLDCEKSYKINGTVQHIGQINDGHYVATEKKQDSWFVCKDNEVMQIPEGDVRNECPYMLFYKLQEDTSE